MDPATQLVAEDVVDETVLGDPAKALESGRRYESIEVMAVAGDLRRGARDGGLDASPELFRGSFHKSKRSGRRAVAILNEASL